MEHELDLAQTTKQIFDECASIYLKEDKHWGSDLDIISEYVEKFSEPSVIDLGTGYAWHLANLFFLTAGNFKHIVGVDYSEKMLERAKALLSSISYQDHLLTEKIQLQAENILSLSFGDETFDVALLLNNTLGNIPPPTFAKSVEQKQKVLREARRLLKNSGFIIISVYNSSKLLEENKYGEVFGLDHNLSNLETFDLVVRFKETGTPYYSHWFSKDEICKLISDVGFNLIEVEERKKRIIVVAQK